MIFCENNDDCIDKDCRKILNVQNDKSELFRFYYGINDELMDILTYECNNCNSSLYRFFVDKIKSNGLYTCFIEKCGVNYYAFIGRKLNNNNIIYFFMDFGTIEPTNKDFCHSGNKSPS